MFVRKLTTVYGSSTVRLSQDVTRPIYEAYPDSFDQIANLIHICAKYGFKFIVKSEMGGSLQKICELLQYKCLLIDLGSLKGITLDHSNQQATIKAGCRTSEVNQELVNNGYEPLFDQQLENLTVYDHITLSLPLRKTSLIKAAKTLALVDAGGNIFYAKNSNSLFGEGPNLISLYLGTGGALAVPLQITIGLNKQQAKYAVPQGEQNPTSNPNTIVQTIRRQVSDWRKSFFLRRNNEYFIFKGYRDSLTHPYNCLFSVSPSILQSVLVTFPQVSTLSYFQNALRVDCPAQIQSALIKHIASLNGVLVWCSPHALYRSIKPSLDSQQVGAGLMGVAVKVRDSLDPKRLLQSHNRFDSYFAKGFFRKVTEFFW